MQTDYDILIGGGGLAGNCLALALQHSGLKIALIEAVSRQQLQAAPVGDRALALAAGTVIMLEALGIWQGVAHLATPIKNIHVSDQGHFGKTRLSAAKQGIKALGYVINARDLEEHVANLVADMQISQFCPAQIAGIQTSRQQVLVEIEQASRKFYLSARLLVGADGGQSLVRQLLHIGQRKTDYQQTALVTTVKTGLPHQYTAFERFTSSGPLALLPFTDKQSAVVWTRSPAEAKRLLALSEAEFTAELQQCFGYRLGQLSLSAPCHAFPLTLIQAEKMFTERTVIIGNAVHQLHPVAGQGFNLGLRDVVQLAEMLLHQDAAGGDLGASELLKTYAAARLQDHQRVIRFTDSLIKIFSNPSLPLAALRNVGLTTLDHIPLAKKLLAQQAMGLAGRLPRLGSRA